MVTAESCTGGWVAQEVTAIAGSSQWFERGFVTYTNLSKQEMLDVDPLIIETHGAVSEQTVRAICMLSILTGNVGIQGGNNGAREEPHGVAFPTIPVGSNPVTASIPCFGA